MNISIESLPGEQWVQITESFQVCVSNMGRLWREGYLTRRGDNGIFPQVVPAKLLSGSKLSQKGYKRVTLSGKQYFVHRLVAKYHIPNTSNKPYINHIDGNKLNNKTTNLEWVTNIENRAHAVSNNLIAIGEKLSKLTSDDIQRIDQLYSQGFTQSQIAKEYKVGRQCISKILRRTCWKYIPKA